MSRLKDQVSELMENKKHILEALKYLDERIEDGIKKANNDKGQEVKDIVESQNMIDEIIVKNTDDILILKKTKDTNSAAIRQLEARIDTLDKEMERTMKAFKDKKVMNEKNRTYEESVNTMECKMCAKELSIW